MIDIFNLAYCTVDCPNEECGYISYLEECIDDEDFTTDDQDLIQDFPKIVSCKCPKCGRKFKAEIVSYVDFSSDTLEE